MAKSREVRKLAQKCATSSTDNGTMTRCGVFTRKRLKAGRGRAGAERERAPIAVLKAGNERSLYVGEREPQRTVSGTHSAIDAGGGRPRLLIGLEANIVQQGGFGERLLRDRRGVVYPHPPAQKMEQIVRIAAQCGLRNASDSLLIQEAVDPRDFPTGAVHHAKRALGVAQSRRLSYSESHRQASSNRR